MNFQQRKQIILDVVEKKGTVEVKELSEILETSEITVRRDLALLSDKGLIYRTHGGAMKIALSKDPFTFIHKASLNADRKDHICEIAARQIVDGDVIFLDCGSTLFRLCPFIKEKKIKVITNSLPVLYELINSQVSINLIGGEVDAERQAVHGEIAKEHIARYKATKAFIGVDGISLSTGLSANSEKEASIALSMAKSAQKVFLLCDSSKLEKEKYFPFAPLSMVDTLITDFEADKKILNRYREKFEVLN
ncbi:MAG TPA: DeoR/GlpR family DNA-binding transcription regulator [Cytophagales bacterium]|nr:DeoR/GlpR family DNA-binding transcription regulator [Cytophagales bacterium]